MNNTKIFSVLAIILAVAIAPMSGAFAQSNIANENSLVDKEQREQTLDQIKEHQKALRDQIRDLDKPDDYSHDRIMEIDPSLQFRGDASGWGIVNGKAHHVTFSIEGQAGEINRGWYLTGVGTIHLGDRNIAFDLKGHAKNNHVTMKGISQSDESVVINLRGHFAPIANSEGSFALAFPRGAILAEDIDIKIPLVLIGDVTTHKIMPVDESDSPSDFDANKTLDEILKLS